MDSSNICRIRDIYRAIIGMEQHFEQNYNLNLNEAMLLCTLHQSSQLTAGEIAEILAITCSNASKVIASAERQNLIRRQLGKVDKRKMLFSLTQEGAERLAALKADPMELPEELR